MRITHAGKIGDLLWALPTMKALGSFDLVTSPYCEGLLPLLRRQGYIKSAEVDPEWEVEFSAPLKPWAPPSGIPGIHLSMREWPSPTIAEYYPKLLKEQYGHEVTPDFSQPWLTLDGWIHNEIVVAFSDEYAESKAGCLTHLLHEFPSQNFRLCVMEGSRMEKDFHFPFRNCQVETVDLLGLASRLRSAKIVIACNSAPHVLGAALGRPVIVYEPQTMRHQTCFKAPVTRISYVDSPNSFEVVSVLKGLL